MSEKAMLNGGRLKGEGSTEEGGSGLFAEERAGIREASLAYGGAERLDLFWHEEHVFVVSQALDHCLRLGRLTQEWELVDRAVVLQDEAQLKHLGCVFGVIGALQLLGGWFLLVITQRRSIGTYAGSRVFAVEEVELVPLGASSPPQRLNNHRAIPRSRPKTLYTGTTTTTTTTATTNASTTQLFHKAPAAAAAAGVTDSAGQRVPVGTETTACGDRDGIGGRSSALRPRSVGGTGRLGSSGDDEGDLDAAAITIGGDGGDGGDDDGDDEVDDGGYAAPDGSDPRTWLRLHRRHVKEIKKMFSFQHGGGFIFSVSGHILHSMKHLADLTPQQRSQPLWMHDDRHWWNKHMQEGIHCRVKRQHTTPPSPPSSLSSSPSSSSLSSFASWILPVMQGFFQQKHITVGPHSGTLTLVSRRSRHRLGCRYKRRGIDAQGHVANAVETEQILKLNGTMCSFIQYRGSIPVFWKQEPLRYEYRPACRILRTPAENMSAFWRHYRDLRARYGETQYWVNLVGHSGRESVVGRAFERVYDALSPQNVTYFAFDYHHMCKANHAKVWDVADVGQVLLDDMGFTAFSAESETAVLTKAPLRVQSGIVRTNCMDCLDRTNVTQSIIGRRILRQQLMYLDAISQRTPLPAFLVQMAQGIWAANGNAISRQYAGTDAMKSEATKAKNIRFFGALNDGRKSLTRYYLNTFHDVFRQQTIDLCQRMRTCKQVAGEGMNMQDREQAALCGATMTFVQRVQMRLLQQQGGGGDGSKEGEGVAKREAAKRAGEAGEHSKGQKKNEEDATRQGRGEFPAKGAEDRARAANSASASTASPQQTELPLVAAPMWRQDEHIGVEVVLLLTFESLIVAYVDFSEEAIISYTRLPLDRVCKVEYGSLSPEDAALMGLPSSSSSASSTGAGLLRGRRMRTRRSGGGGGGGGVAAIRIYVKHEEEDLVSRLVSGRFGVWYSDLLRLGLCDSDEEANDDDDDDGGGGGGDGRALKGEDEGNVVAEKRHAAEAKARTHGSAEGQQPSDKHDNSRADAGGNDRGEGKESGSVVLSALVSPRKTPPSPQKQPASAPSTTATTATTATDGARDEATEDGRAVPFLPVSVDASDREGEDEGDDTHTQDSSEGVRRSEAQEGANMNATLMTAATGRTSSRTAVDEAGAEVPAAAAEDLFASLDESAVDNRDDSEDDDDGVNMSLYVPEPPVECANDTTAKDAVKALGHVDAATIDSNNSKHSKAASRNDPGSSVDPSERVNASVSAYDDQGSGDVAEVLGKKEKPARPPPPRPPPPKITSRSPLAMSPRTRRSTTATSSTSSSARSRSGTGRSMDAGRKRTGSDRSGGDALVRPRRPTMLRPEDRVHMQTAAPAFSIGGKDMHFAWCTLRPVQFNNQGHLEPTNSHEVIASVASGFKAVLQQGRHRFQLKAVKTLTSINTRKSA